MFSVIAPLIKSPLAASFLPFSCSLTSNLSAWSCTAFNCTSNSSLTAFTSLAITSLFLVSNASIAVFTSS